MKKFMLLFLVGFIPCAFAQTAELLPGEQDTIDVFRKTSPYVVNVHRVRQVIDFLWKSRKIAVGTGSGFLWDTRGHVVTNYHVVAGAKEIAVTLINGKTIRATLLGQDTRKDIAVLKLANYAQANALIHNKFLPVANTDKLAVGQTAIAIGNPFGLSQTITEGIVSALNREISGGSGVLVANMIQTDASINPGNSGGPLLDSAGQLIGMNTMIFSRSGTSAGVGFAIPANTIRRIVSQILKYGFAIQPGIGIMPVPDAMAAQLAVRGVVIAKVIPDTPAAKAGLLGLAKTLSGQYVLGDVILAIDGQRTETFEKMVKILDKVNVGQRIRLTVQRGNKQFDVELNTINLNQKN